MSLPAGVMDESAATLVNITPNDGRKNRSKHIELTRNNKLTYIVASRWLNS